MTGRDSTKVLLQKVIRPLLSLEKPQRRFAILHEVLPNEQSALHALIHRLNEVSTLDVTLTFDDGFRSSAETIASLQNKKVLFFICPEFIERATRGGWEDFFSSRLLRKEDPTDPTLRDAVRPASWDELRSLVRLGHTIGSHTMTHARLSRLRSRRELEHEIRASADIIEDKLQVPVESLSYPFGDVASIGPDALELIRQRYRYCYSGVRGNNTDESAFLRWRDTTHLYWPMEYNEFLLRGGFDMLSLYKRRSMMRMVRETSISTV